MSERAAGTADPLLHDVFAGLDSVGVRWALLRGLAGLGVAGHDVDLLVAAEEVDRAEDVFFALGGVRLPRRLHPWHRFYVLEDPGAPAPLKLDVVDRLVYHRGLRLHSGLEDAVLDGSVRAGAVRVLGPTDLFWTVLLHCLLDKQAVNERRQAELTASAPLVVRPSPGEEYFQGLCAWPDAASSALDLVRSGDWAALVDLGARIVTAAGGAPSSPEPPVAEGSPSGALTTALARTRVPRRWARTATARVYPHVWRAAGLGATPLALDVVESSEIEVLVTRLDRRPGWCDVEVAVVLEEQDSLATGLRQEGYRWLSGAWTRLGPRGLERVRVGSMVEPPGTGEPMFRRTYCRRPAATWPQKEGT